jgi:uncharacterized protein YdaU (DUF1376 family)
MNHYPRHVGDITRDTFGLSTTEFGCYDRMLDHYYASEAPLPLDVGEVYRITGARTPADRKATEYVLGKFFSKEADGWHQKRCDKEILRYQARADSARHNGANGGRPRTKSKPDENRTITESVISGLANETESKANQEPEPVTNNQGGRASPARARATRPHKTPIPDDFGISPTVRQWAAEHGHVHLDERLQHFIGKARANGYRYADWDQALQNAIRDDWAALNNRRSPRGGSSLSDVGHRTADALGTWLNDEEQANGTTGP